LYAARRGGPIIAGARPKARVSASAAGLLASYEKGVLKQSALSHDKNTRIFLVVDNMPPLAALTAFGRLCYTSRA
jgi:hypothetical protein